MYEFQCFDAFNDQLLRNNIELGNTRHRGNLCEDNIRRKVCENLAAQIDSRYPKIDVLAHFSVLFNCHNYPSTLEELVGPASVQGHGEDSCLYVLEWYARSAHVDVACEEQWVLTGCSEWPIVRGWFHRRSRKKVSNTYKKRHDYDSNGVILPKRLYESVTEEINRPVADILTEFIAYCEDRHEEGEPLYQCVSYACPCLSCLLHGQCRS